MKTVAGLRKQNIEGSKGSDALPRSVRLDQIVKVDVRSMNGTVVRRDVPKTTTSSIACQAVGRIFRCRRLHRTATTDG
jgi:hypothetical protein